MNIQPHPMISLLCLYLQKLEKLTPKEKDLILDVLENLKIPLIVQTERITDNELKRLKRSLIKRTDILFADGGDHAQV